MKIPAIRGKIGDWTYYSTILTFEQVSNYVSKIDDQLHKSDTLKDLIQRSITNNYLSIKEYILNQNELFFNSLVLAVYDDYPNWIEVEFSFKENSYYNMGLLDFPSRHKIFPVDGQHRVEGIKAAIKENPDLSSNQVSVVFIGHKNDQEGKKRTRRLFTTLNRYAKPVELDDIIALDEDDTVAITTRDLVEEFPLFEGERIVYAGQKGISKHNKKAFTSIITLYQCNIEIFKEYYLEKYGKKATKSKLDEYLKFRRSNEEIKNFYTYLQNFWGFFSDNLDPISNFLNEKSEYAIRFRNSNGGNLLFRPVGLLPFINACIKIKHKTLSNYQEIFKRMNKLNFDINTNTWQHILWDPLKKNMIMSNKKLTELIIIYLYDKDLLTQKEEDKLKKDFASKKSLDDPDKALQMIK